MKQKLLEVINEFKKAVEEDNVPTIIGMYEKLGIDSRRTTILDRYLTNFLIKDIKAFVQKQKDKKLKVVRMGIYHEPTTDFYKVENEELMRNGNPAKWTSIGKLYVAYKRIHGIENKQ